LAGKQIVKQTIFTMHNINTTAAPSIASSVGSIPEIILNNHLIPINNAKELAN
jgi:hypothetical protein